MKLAVFGGTGRTGKPLIEQALAAGHHVTALVRDPARLGITNPNLTVVRGDATNPADVARTVEGAEVVISTLGPVKGAPDDIMEQAARNIVAAMRQHGVTKLVSMTGAGVPDPKDDPQLIDNIFGFLLKTLQGKILADAQRHVDILKASGLPEWTVVRGPMLTDDPYNGQFVVGFKGKGMGARARRPNIAAFMLQQAQDMTFKGQLPMISDKQ